MIVGAAGDAGGLVLDATGVGAVIGVPVNIVSTAAVVAGGAMVAGISRTTAASSRSWTTATAPTMLWSAI
jgi:riboflavin transporter FmnP